MEQYGALARDTGPRLLRMKRLGLLVMGQTIDEDPVDEMVEVAPQIRHSRLSRQNRARLKGTTDKCILMQFLMFLLIAGIRSCSEFPLLFFFKFFTLN